MLTSDIALNTQRECKALAMVEPVCAYVANITAISLPCPLPAAKVTEAVAASSPVSIAASQAFSAGGETVLAGDATAKQSWWQIAADLWSYLGFILPLLWHFVPINLAFLPAWLRPANNDNNRQEGADELVGAFREELAQIRAQLADLERSNAALRAQLNRAPGGDEVEGVPEEPAEEVLPGEASSQAEPKGDNSIHAASEGESEAFDVANSGLKPDDKPEQAEGSTAEAGSDGGRPKRRTHRSKAGRAKRHERRAMEREEEARREMEARMAEAEAEREAAFRALYRVGEEGGGAG